MLGIVATSIVVIIGFFNLNFLPVVNAQSVSICQTLKELKGNETNDKNSALRLRRIYAFCNAIHASSQVTENKEDTDSIPDFDLAQIDSENDANQILKRFRRGRGGGGGGRGGGGGGRGGGGRSGGGRSSFGGSRSGGSRIFSGSRSSSSRISSGSRASSSSGTRVFSRSGSHRVRSTLRSMMRSSSSSGSRAAIRTGSSSYTSGSKPSIGERIRTITQGVGGSGGARVSSGGNRFGIGGSSGSIWVRSGKTFLPQAARFGKRYYQRRKYNQGMYTGVGYYSGSHMVHHTHYYPHGYYGYPPVAEKAPQTINGTAPTVFYCIQEDLNTTLVNKTLNNEGLGVCNISGKLVTCPVEIECKIADADTCCEDEQGAPFCCGGPLPSEYISQFGGYADDWRASAESINTMLNIATMVMIMMATVCFTVWHRREQ